MAVLRALSHLSAVKSSLRPSLAARLSRQLHGAKIFRVSGSLGSHADARVSRPTNLDLEPSLWTLIRVKRRLVAPEKSPFCTRAAAGWADDYTPYETLEIERDAEDEEIKSSYRRLAKQFHPDVYNTDAGGLRDGESPEARFIKIQAAYELLMDNNQRKQYDMDNRVNPIKASKAWMDWVMKKRKAFDQRGDMAASVWAEQQQREMSLKARRLAKHKMDPEEERRILAKEKLAMSKNYETTLNRHTLVLKKRELSRRKDAEEAKKKLVQQLLAAEGLELADGEQL